MHKGFSLIEVIVVIAIVGMLAVISHAGFTKYMARGKVSEASQILGRYQIVATGMLAREGAIDPYYVLFTDTDTSGLVSGSPGGTAAEKDLSLEYISTVTADIGTDASDNRYILLGVGLQNDQHFINGADHVYVVGIETPGGVFSWKCGRSVSKGDTIPEEYLPKNCVNALP